MFEGSVYNAPPTTFRLSLAIHSVAFMNVKLALAAKYLLNTCAARIPASK